MDATGQSALIGRALGLRRVDPHFRNLAVYGYYEGARRLPSRTTQHLHRILRAWVVLGHPAPHRARRGRRRRGRAASRERVRGGALADFLHAEIAKTTLTRQLLGGASLEDGPQTSADRPPATRRPAAHG